MKKSIVTALLALVCAAGLAQTTVKGHVVNEKGESVEYVSVGIEEDSVGVISDAKGYFAITIPKGRKEDLSFSHVSYQASTLPYREYASGKELTVVLRDKVVELAEVVIGKKNKPQTIAGKALSGPVASFRGKGKQKGTEWGPVFKSKRDYAVSDILLKIKGSTYKWCVLSFNIYEVKGGKFHNILNKPIYYRLDNPSTKVQIDVRPEETILLKGKQKYYISVAVVDSDAYGMLEMQSEFKSSYARSFAKGKIRKLPVGPAILVKGYEVE